MKKGVSYIDISVSAGIFILYLLFIFVTLRPGIKEDIKGEYLIQILQRALYNNITMEVEKYPLFIYYDPGYDLGGPLGIATEGIIVMDNFPFTWRYTDYLLEENTTRINDTILSTDEGISFNIKPMPGNPDKYTLTMRVQDLIPSLSTPNTFWIIHSSSFNLTPDDGVDFGDPPDTETPRILTPDHYFYQFGVRESLFGINLEAANNLIKDTTKLKKDFNFPDRRNFDIIIYKGDDGSILYRYLQNPFDETEKSIFVLQWSDSLIQSDGTTVPIIVNLRAW
ncbi:hypothetical protein J4471_05230 [Candidatus Woesearchaeota archaeon]|nr:hypothetical protein [Candidatus Woesearchaeota archaeon]